MIDRPVGTQRSNMKARREMTLPWMSRQQGSCWGMGRPGREGSSGKGSTPTESYAKLGQALYRPRNPPTLLAAMQGSAQSTKALTIVYRILTCRVYLVYGH